MAVMGSVFRGKCSIFDAAYVAVNPGNAFLFFAYVASSAIIFFYLNDSGVRGHFLKILAS